MELQHKQLTRTHRMNTHPHARTTVLSRAALVRRIRELHQPVAAVAAALGISTRTAYKWLARWRKEGRPGLRERSSRPKCSPRTTHQTLVTRVLQLRRLRLPGFQIARATGLSRATVSRLLRRHGLTRLAALEPPPPVRRYQRALPGELIHLDIKKLARIERLGHRITGNRQRDHVRGAGWEFLHVAIDDASRIAFAQLLPDERAQSALRFLHAALAYFRRLGIRPQHLMTDNGSCYIARAFGHRLRRLGLRHLRTRPYTPRTNGKAERFIQTSLREWAYAHAYHHSTERAARLPLFLHRYNWHRPHCVLKLSPPISTLPLHLNNLLSLHS